MSFPKDDNELDKTLSEAFISPPPADFDAWQRRHPEAVAWLDPQRTADLLKRKRLMGRTIVFATTAVVAICVWLGLTCFDMKSPGTTAFAQTIAQIEKAKTIAFCVTFHSLATGLDGKKWTEVHTIQRVIKEPGLWRSTELDKDGQVVKVQIRDFVHGRELIWKPKEKKAVLRDSEPEPRFSGMTDYLKEKLAVRDWQWVKKREMATGTANVFRHTFKEMYRDRFYKEQPKEHDSSYDVWVDQKTKKLVRFQIPGADIYDFDQHPVRDASPEYHDAETQGLIYSDFVFDAELDDSLFSFQPPEGYAVESEDYPQVTEKDIIEYLGLLAKCREQTFPDQVSQFPFFPIDWINEVMNKKHPTLVEKQFVEKHLFFYKVNQKPFTRFAECNTEANSFRYLGKGVKLGEKDRIVCWYKLKNAKNPDTYRVVYGDLSVKDVAPEDLPLPVGP